MSSCSTIEYDFRVVVSRCTWRVQAQPGQKINITLLDFTVGVPGEPAHTMCLVSTAIVNALKIPKTFQKLCLFVCLFVCSFFHLSYFALIGHPGNVCLLITTKFYEEGHNDITDITKEGSSHFKDLTTPCAVFVIFYCLSAGVRSG